MTQRKSLLEQALDVCLYAPVGLAISVTEELPQLIDKGRTRVNSQLAMAKMVGSFAVAQGQREAERVVRQATGRVVDGGPLARPPAGGAGSGDLGAARWSAPAGEAETTNGDSATRVVDDGASSDGAAATVPPAAAPTEEGSAPAPAAARPAGDAGALAIPGYDALSASQVVQRLAGLSADELEAVRTYETATRGRRTILNRIAQLQGPGRS